MSEKRCACPGELTEKTGEALLEAVREQRPGRDDVIVFDLADTESMNSLGGAWLMRITRELRKKGADFQFENATGHVADFMEFIEPGLQSREPAPPKRENVLEKLGGAAIDSVKELRQFGNLVVDAVYWTCIAVFEGRGFRWELFIDELHEMGVRAVRINAMMNLLLGLIIAMLSAAQLEQFGALIYVADLVVIAFFRELAAIMTAVVVSARTGAAIAAEISTMKVQEEIDALRGMGLNVTQFLVAPKIIALLVAMPCLVALGMVMGIVGGSMWSILVMDVDAGAWTRQLQGAADLGDFAQGMIKSLIFAIVIVMIGCHNGFRVSGGSRGVGLMTTRAVVMDIFAIIDMIFAMLYYYIF